MKGMIFGEFKQLVWRLLMFHAIAAGFEPAAGANLTILPRKRFLFGSFELLAVRSGGMNPEGQSFPTFTMKSLGALDLGQETERKYAGCCEHRGA